MIVASKLAKNGQQLPDRIKGEICSITKYLYDYGKLGTLAYLSRENEALTPRQFTKQLGFDYNRKNCSFEFSTRDGARALIYLNDVEHYFANAAKDDTFAQRYQYIFENDDFEILCLFQDLKGNRVTGDAGDLQITNVDVNFLIKFKHLQ